MRDAASRLACSADSVDRSAAITTSQYPAAPRKRLAATATTVSGWAWASAVID